MLQRDQFFFSGNKQAAEAEYAAFKRCLPQLMDQSAMTGDLTGKWVIFENGWLGDFQGFDTAAKACGWSQVLHGPNSMATWIVARVNLEDHKINPLELLGDAIADAELEEE